MANFQNRNVVEFLRDFNLIDPIVTKKKISQEKQHENRSVIFLFMWIKTSWHLGNWLLNMCDMEWDKKERGRHGNHSSQQWFLSAQGGPYIKSFLECPAASRKAKNSSKPEKKSTSRARGERRQQKIGPRPTYTLNNLGIVHDLPFKIAFLKIQSGNLKLQSI